MKLLFILIANTYWKFIILNDTDEPNTVDNYTATYFYLGISHGSPSECHSSVSLLVTQFIKRFIASWVKSGDRTLAGKLGAYFVS